MTMDLAEVRKLVAGGESQFVHAQRRWENEAESDWDIDDLDTEEIVRTAEKAIELGRLDDPETRDPVGSSRTTTCESTSRRIRPLPCAKPW